MEPDRPCLDALERLLDRGRTSAGTSPAPKSGHSCPGCEGLDRVVEELRALPTVCGQAGDDALLRAIAEKSPPVSSFSPAAPTTSLTSIMVGAALLGAGLLGTVIWQSRTSQPSPLPTARPGLASEAAAAPASSSVPATPALRIDGTTPGAMPENGQASGSNIGILDPDDPSAGIK